VSRPGINGFNIDVCQFSCVSFVDVVNLFILIR
jgi:hypothetical protein